MTHSKLDKAIDEILVFPQPGESYDDYMDVHLLDGELMCYHITEQGKKKLKQALLEAFEQSLNTIIGEDEWEDPDIKGSSQTNGDQVEAPWRRNHLRQSQRNEAIKVIRGNDE